MGRLVHVRPRDSRFPPHDFPANTVHHGTWTNHPRSPLNCNQELDLTVHTSSLLVQLAGIAKVAVT
jgi:hypothetical protein